jgi:hypothetical protein
LGNIEIGLNIARGIRPTFGQLLFGILFDPFEYVTEESVALCCNIMYAIVHGAQHWYGKG